MHIYPPVNTLLNHITYDHAIQYANNTTHHSVHCSSLHLTYLLIINHSLSLCIMFPYRLYTFIHSIYNHIQYYYLNYVIHSLLITSYAYTSPVSNDKPSPYIPLKMSCIGSVYPISVGHFLHF